MANQGALEMNSSGEEGRRKPDNDLRNRVVILIVSFFGFLSRFFRSAVIFLPGIVTIFVSYKVFISLTQGQDVIMQVSEYPVRGVATYIGIFLWASLVWYSSRIIAYQKDEYIRKQCKCDHVAVDEKMMSFLDHLPKLMAFNAVLSVQAAILGLPTIQHIFSIDINSGMFTIEICVFIAVNNILYFSLHSWVIAKKAPAKYCTVIIIILNMALWCFFIGYYQWYLQHTEPSLIHVWRLSLYAIVLFLGGIILLRIVILRRMHKDPGKEGNSIMLGQRKIVDTDGYDEELTFGVFVLVFLGTAIVYFLCIGNIRIADKLGPLAFVLIAFGFLITVGNTITYFSHVFKVNLFFFLIVLGIGISLLPYDPYDVRMHEMNPGDAEKYSDRPDLIRYFKKWVHDPARLKCINSTDTFDVYIELADGGASRSGYWVASVLSALEDCTKKTDSSRFSNHLFSLSGASGGTIGNAAFYTMLCGDKKTDYTLRAQKFLGTDFLSFTLSHLLGPDIWGHFGIYADRAGALEEVMDRAADSMYPGAFSNYLNTYFDTSGRLPVFFFNTTEVQHGRPSIVSPVRIDDFSKRYDVVDTLIRKCPGENMRLSTAAVLSARFPYISPAGNLGGVYFVDGGYFDNSGAGITNEMMFKIDSFINFQHDSADAVLYHKLRFCLVHITNTPLSHTPDSRIPSIENNIAAPVITVLSTYSSQTNVNDERLKGYFQGHDSLDHHHVINPIINLYASHGDADYPMNWVISDYNLRRMNYRLKDAIDTLKRLRKFGLSSSSDTFKVILQNP